MSDFKPIIQHKNASSGLKTKDVQIQGTNDFGIGNVELANVKSAKETTDPAKSKDPRYKASTTAKLSPYENLRLQTLKPFMAETEESDTNTINDIVGLLINSYVDKRLSSRQSEAFEKIVEMQFEQMKFSTKKK